MQQHPVTLKEIVHLPQMKSMKRALAVTFDLHDGKQGCWEGVYCPPAVVIVAMTKEGKLILIRQWRFLLESFSIELPGGSVEEGEDFITAAGRELREELGLETDKPLEFLTQGPLWPGRSNATQHVYVARDCRKVCEPELDPVEQVAQLEMIELSAGEIADRIASGDITINSTLGSILIALDRKGLSSFYS